MHQCYNLLWEQSVPPHHHLLNASSWKMGPATVPKDEGIAIANLGSKVENGLGWDVLENPNQTSPGGQFKLQLSQRVIYMLKELNEFTCDRVNQFQRKFREK